MHRLVALSLFAVPLFATLGGCVAPYTDTALLCARDAACSAHPLPSGQNGVAWSPQGHNRTWTLGGPSPMP